MFSQKLARVINPGDEIALENKQAWHATPMEFVFICSF
jgi:hypothetical protein